METETKKYQNIDEFGKKINEVNEKLKYLGSDCPPPESAEELEKLEHEIVETTDQLAALLIGRQIQQSLDSSKIKDEERKLVKSAPKPLKNNSNKDVSIQSLRGPKVTVNVTYYYPKGKGGKKKRKGLYVGLILLGIHDRYSPASASEVTMIAVAMCSLEEGRKMLKERGLNIDVKTLRDLTYRHAARVRAILENKDIEFDENVSGCRVVISVDGGRIRIRKNKTGPKTKKGRTRFHTDWKEPKLLNIYIVDKDGKKQREFMPFIDGTMKGPDKIFMLLKYYLIRLGIKSADTLLIVGDGARWIWNRIPGLLEDLGIETNRVYELLDFYHAVEHLGKVASLRKSWSEAQRKRWVKKQRGLLKKGRVDDVIKAVKDFCRGRNGKKARRERNYFIHNKDRMKYVEIAGLNLPLGSGAMESAIRRVVNLRMKGAGIFWDMKSAEAMLLLRSFYKAGRWNMLKRLSLSYTHQFAF